MIKYLSILILLFSSNAIAEEKKSCAEFETEIRKDARELGGCWDDKDCVAANLGCPWQRRICTFTLLSKSEPKKNNALKKKTTKFQKDCINTNPELKKKCNKYDSMMAKAVCPQLRDLLCVNGKCVTKTHIIIQGIKSGSKGLREKRIWGRPEDTIMKEIKAKKDRLEKNNNDVIIDR